MHRLVTGTVVTLACMLVAAACTANGSNPPATPPSSAPSPAPRAAGPATLRFAVYGEQPLVDAYTEMAEAFTRANPLVRVRVVASPDSAAAGLELDQSFAAGAGPDVFLTPQDQLPRLIAEDRVQPVDVLLGERGVDFGDGYQRDGLAAFSADSALACMPHDVSALVVYYNEDLLDIGSLGAGIQEAPSAELGWSWEQFATAARRMSRGATKGVHFPPDLEVLAPFIWSGGGDVVDDVQEPTTLSMTNGDTRGAVEEVLSLVRDPEVTPSRAELATRGAVARFKQGKLGMVLGTRALTPELREAEGLDFEVLPLPTLGVFRTVATMSGYCLSAQSRHLAAAADLLAFAVGRRGATITSRSGYVVPSNLEVVHSSAFTQPSQQPANDSLFSDGVRLADETPFVAKWPAVVKQSRPLLKKMIYAPVIDLEALLTEMDTRSQAVLAPVEGPRGE